MASTRKPIISGNWKMHKNHFEAIQAVQKLHYRLDGDDHDNVVVTVHPPFTDLRSIQTIIESDRMKIELGAQNCHWEDQGAFTGEVAPPMLAKLQPVVDLRREIGRIDTEISGLQAQQIELDQRADETRQNLEAIKKDPAAGTLRKKLSDRLEDFTFFQDAYVTRWSLSGIDATASGVVIEEMELSYLNFKSFSL